MTVVIDKNRVGTRGFCVDIPNQNERLVVNPASESELGGVALIKNPGTGNGYTKESFGFDNRGVVTLKSHQLEIDQLLSKVEAARSNPILYSASETPTSFEARLEQMMLDGMDRKLLKNFVRDKLECFKQGDFEQFDWKWRAKGFVKVCERFGLKSFQTEFQKIADKHAV